MGVIEAVLNRGVARFYLRLSAQIRVYLRSSDFFSWLGQIPSTKRTSGDRPASSAPKSPS
jgi:hypothetical protein